MRVHLTAAGYQQHGEKLGSSITARRAGPLWGPQRPAAAPRSGRTITVRFDVPVSPLAWEESFGTPSSWPNGRGFEVRAGATNIEIASVEIIGGGGVITCASDLPAGAVTVGYAMTEMDVPPR
jgi:hypothetical protein